MIRTRLLSLTLLAMAALAAPLAAQPVEPKDKGAAAPAPLRVAPAPAAAPVPAQPIVYNPYRFVVYPWVAAAPMRCYYWWQYPWYAVPGWGNPRWPYVPAYYVTPWGYWYLPANYYTYRAYQQAPPRPVVRPLEPIAATRSAESLYLEGYDRYFASDVLAATKLLSAAVERDSSDARVWYIKALAERELGDEAAAQASARRGAALELLNGAQHNVAQTLERVQGDTRRFLRAAGADLTVATAKEIVAAPVKLATSK